MRTKIAVSVCVLAFWVAACAPEPKKPAGELPAVSDDSCAPENIAKLDPKRRQQFADQCFRRGQYHKSSGKVW